MTDVEKTIRRWAFEQGGTLVIKTESGEMRVGRQAGILNHLTKGTCLILFPRTRENAGAILPVSQITKAWIENV